MTAKRVTIGITMGDPAGIGPEIVVRALTSDPSLRERAKFVIFGLHQQLKWTAGQLGAEWNIFRDDPANIRPYVYDCVVLDYGLDYLMPNRMARESSKLGGKASLRFVEDATAAALAGTIDAIVTAPISKASWAMAGQKKHPGHTDLIANRCGVRHYAMMFVSPQLRVTLATIHDPIISIRDKLSIGAVYNPIELTHNALRDWFGIEHPRIGVAGLNPHAGEEGHIGDEEGRIIEPAIFMARENGFDATGPIPADSVFNRALSGEFDSVLAMYHDQGMIPIKLLGRGETVNVTLGLPIIRTSPDHGTAFDIAGKFSDNCPADPSSFTAALNLAITLAQQKQQA